MVGRIIKGVGGHYSVSASGKIYTCLARGKFRIREITPLVGDVVDFDVTDEENRTGFLTDIKPRKNELIRPRVSNVDVVLIVVSAVFPSVNIELLDCLLLNAEHSAENAEKIICLNKIDITNEENAGEIAGVKPVYEKIGYKTLLASATENLGINELKKHLRGKTSVAAGPSGVGKSSLLNALVPEMAEKAETGELSRKIARGKHTTRHAELFAVPGFEDTYIVDTPGFSSVTTEMIPKDELADCFIEFRPFLGQCFFNDCAHVTEHGCAVKDQIGEAVDAGRYERYVKFRG